MKSKNMRGIPRTFHDTTACLSCPGDPVYEWLWLDPLTNEMKTGVKDFGEMIRTSEQISFQSLLEASAAKNVSFETYNLCALDLDPLVTGPALFKRLQERQQALRAQAGISPAPIVPPPENKEMQK